MNVIIRDVGEACSLEDCPPGLFRVGDVVGLKTEYRMILGRDAGGGKVEFNMSNWPEAYVVESGEAWWGGTSTHADRAAQIVQPITIERA